MTEVLLIGLCAIALFIGIILCADCGPSIGGGGFKGHIDIDLRDKSHDSPYDYWR